MKTDSSGNHLRRKIKSLFKQRIN